MTMLFAHLATRLAPSPENIAIEALGYILARSPAARTAMVRSIGAGGVELTDLHFATQAPADDPARPDIEGYTAKGARACVVECKFWAGLTANQPLTYAARLPTDRRGALAFVVPATRLTSLWSELARRMAEGGLPLAERSEPEPEAWTSSFGPGHAFVLLSWRFVLNAIRHAMEDSGEVEHLGDLRQLAGLCERMDTEAFQPFRSEELTGTDTARRYAQLGQLAYDVGDMLIARETCDARKLTPAAGIGYYGRYLRYCDNVFFLGFDSLAWAAHGRSPLWLRFDHNAPAELRTRLRRTKTVAGDKPVIVETDRRILVPLHLEPGLERPALVAALATEAAALLAELIAASGERSTGRLPTQPGTAPAPPSAATAGASALVTNPAS